jgi:hypothetical protein
MDGRVGSGRDSGESLTVMQPMREQQQLAHGPCTEEQPHITRSVPANFFSLSEMETKRLGCLSGPRTPHPNYVPTPRSSARKEYSNSGLFFCELYPSFSL